MLIKTKQPTFEQVLESYLSLTDKIFYREVSLEKKKGPNLEKDITLLKQNGISVVLVDVKRKKNQQYFAPGLDPYQARKSIIPFLDRLYSGEKLDQKKTEQVAKKTKPFAKTEDIFTTNTTEKNSFNKKKSAASSRLKK